MAYLPEAAVLWSPWTLDEGLGDGLGWGEPLPAPPSLRPAHALCRAVCGGAAAHVESVTFSTHDMGHRTCPAMSGFKRGAVTVLRAPLQLRR